jgi:hypothetical protein
MEELHFKKPIDVFGFVLGFSSGDGMLRPPW